MTDDRWEHRYREAANYGELYASLRGLVEAMDRGWPIPPEMLARARQTLADYRALSAQAHERIMGRAA